LSLSPLSLLPSTVAGFADSFTTKQLTFTRAVGSEIDVQKLCVGSTCVTQQQFQATVAAAGQSNVSQSGGGAAATDATPPSSGGSSSSSQSNTASTTPDTTPPAVSAVEPPVIQINGDNPVHIHVGDTYSDLGATITGPQADLNLGIHTFVGATPMDQAVIDTHTAATYHINYVVTDSAGLTATSTRTVIVEPAASTIPVQATSTSSNPPSNSTATSSSTTTATPPPSAPDTTTTQATSSSQ
jgi:hypothetical protein